MSFIYPDIDQAVAVHKMTVRVSGGGADGILDAGRLESVLQHIQNDDYYPTFEEKLSLISAVTLHWIKRLFYHLFRNPSPENGKS